MHPAHAPTRPQGELAIQRLQRQLAAAPRLARVQWSPPGQEQRCARGPCAATLGMLLLLTTASPAGQQQAAMPMREHTA